MVDERPLASSVDEEEDDVVFVCMTTGHDNDSKEAYLLSCENYWYANRFSGGEFCPRK